MQGRDRQSERLARATPDLSDSSYESYIQTTPGLIVLIFSVDHAELCQAFVPTLLSLAIEFTGIVSFFRIDVDDAPQATAALSVGAVPTLIFSRNGAELGRLHGILGKEELRSRIASLLLGGPWIPA